MMYFISVIFFKMMRLFLPYLVIILSLKISMLYYKEVSAVEIASNDHITCENNFWRNILYIDIFYPLTERVSD